MRVIAALGIAAAIGMLLSVLNTPARIAWSMWRSRVNALRITIRGAQGKAAISNYPEMVVEDECLWKPDGESFGEFYAERFDAQTRFEGFERALLSFSRTDALAPYYETYAALGEQPKLLIWGNADPEIPRAHIDFLRTKLGNLSYAEIEGAGHGVTTERAAEVNRKIMELLQ